MDQQEKEPKTEKPAIPLSLEDSCLAWLFNDLENYSLELLALHPFRLRYRLLTNLPVLDRCQLECTSVALGVDLESIWKLKFPPWNDVQVESQNTTDGLKRAPLSHPSSWPCYINMLHMASQHPDIHMRSLKIRIRCLEVVGADSAMFEDDLKSLLQIPTLTCLSLPVLPTGLNPGNLFSLPSQENCRLTPI